MHKVLGLAPNPIQGHPSLHNESEANLGYKDNVSKKKINPHNGARKMAQQIKALATKTDNLGVVPQNPHRKKN